MIPGANLLADPELGIDRFMQDVDDIYVYFQTYAYAGAWRRAAHAETAAEAVTHADEAAGTDAARRPRVPPPPGRAQADAAAGCAVLRRGAARRRRADERHADGDPAAGRRA